MKTKDKMKRAYRQPEILLLRMPDLMTNGQLVNNSPIGGTGTAGKGNKDQGRTGFKAKESGFFGGDVEPTNGGYSLWED